MQSITFGIDKGKNVIVQFPVFIQPYTQQPLILYQIETVPVPVTDQNTQAQSYMHLQVNKPYIALNSETDISIRQQSIYLSSNNHELPLLTMRCDVQSRKKIRKFCAIK